MMIERVPAGFIRFYETAATSLAGAAGRALLVAFALACGLVLLDGLLDGLEWTLTRDRRAAEDAVGRLTGGAALLVLASGGALARERLRRALTARRAREVVWVDLLGRWPRTRPPPH